MIRAALVSCLLVAAACGRESGSGQPRKPAGTSADPVTVCERLADVCRIDGARLGVCSAAKSGPALVCAPQH